MLPECLGLGGLGYITQTHTKLDIDMCISLLAHKQDFTSFLTSANCRAFVGPSPPASPGGHVGPIVARIFSHRINLFMRIRQFSGCSNVCFPQTSTTPPRSTWLLRPNGAEAIRKPTIPKKMVPRGPTKGRRSGNLTTCGSHYCNI